jgi:hypothetical protein
VAALGYHSLLTQRKVGWSLTNELMKGVAKRGDTLVTYIYIISYLTNLVAGFAAVAPWQLICGEA